jgi:hypothetical protein
VAEPVAKPEDAEAPAATPAEPVAQLVAEPVVKSEDAEAPAPTPAAPVEQQAAEPVMKPEIAEAPAAVATVAPAPVAAEPAAAPAPLLQEMASDNFESASLLAIGLGAVGVAVIMALAYVFLGK